LPLNVIDTRPPHKAPAQTSHFEIKVEISAAIVDRITFGGNIIETGTDSYRLAHTLCNRDKRNRDKPDAK